MTNEQIQALITTIANSVQANSISPAILATVLRAIQDFANSQQQVEPATIQALQARIQNMEDFAEYVDYELFLRAPKGTTLAEYGITDAINTSQRGKANGVASLNHLGQVPSTQLPSYVDDVIEFEKQVSGTSWLANALATDTGSVIWVATAASNLSGGTTNKYYHKFVINTDETEAGLQIVAPETGKIYVCLVDNNTYRWSGSSLVEVSKSIGLGESSTTAYPGNKGKKNADNLATLSSDYKTLEQRVSALESGGNPSADQPADFSVFPYLDIVGDLVGGWGPGEVKSLILNGLTRIGFIEYNHYIYDTGKVDPATVYPAFKIYACSDQSAGQDHSQDPDWTQYVLAYGNVSASSRRYIKTMGQDSDNIVIAQKGEYRIEVYIPVGVNTGALPCIMITKTK